MGFGKKKSLWFIILKTLQDNLQTQNTSADLKKYYEVDKRTSPIQFRTTQRLQGKPKADPQIGFSLYSKRVVRGVWYFSGIILGKPYDLMCRLLLGDLIVVQDFACIYVVTFVKEWVIYTLYTSLPYLAFHCLQCCLKGEGLGTRLISSRQIKQSQVCHARLVLCPCDIDKK